MPEGRRKRVAELIREEIASLLQRGVKDPRIGFVSVMEVTMSPDLRYADVFVSLFGSESAKKGSLAGLRNSAAWIRRELGGRLRLRFTPELRFHEDSRLDRAYRLEEAFKQIHEEEDRETPN